MAGYNNNRYGNGNQNRNARPNYNANNEVKITPINLEGEKSYVDIAEEVILKIKDNKGKKQLTTSKIRNILAMTTEIYNDVIHYSQEKLSADLVERIQYLRLRVAYEYGRDDAVKDFVEKSDLINQIKKIGSSKKKFLIYVKYMEALVAYHRFYGGKDN